MLSGLFGSPVGMGLFVERVFKGCGNFLQDGSVRIPPGSLGLRRLCDRML